MITPLPGASPTQPGSATLPLPGIFADIVDETGHPVGRGKGGILVISRPWPAMLRTIWGDAERYKKTYWPDDFKNKLYLAGDGASTDEEGYFRIVGRIDDVLNVSGHRLGTMEIESALVAHSKLVAEAAVVGRPDDLTGEAVCATGSARRSAPSPSRRTSASATICPRRARARSCAGCCARLRAARRLPRTSRRWRTRRSWSS
jgi:acetyl-CoA synthetase